MTIKQYVVMCEPAILEHYLSDLLSFLLNVAQSNAFNFLGQAQRASLELTLVHIMSISTLKI